MHWRGQNGQRQGPAHEARGASAQNRMEADLERAQIDVHFP